MKKLTEDQIIKNLESFYSLIEKSIQSPRKEKLLKLYQDSEDILATAPAAPNVNHHNAFPGGYIDHVLRVVDYSIYFNKLWTKLGQEVDYTEEELIFSAINHDLGKLGLDQVPMYIPNDSSWHIEKLGQIFKINDSLPHMRVADRSLFHLMKYEIPVSQNEWYAIKLHDGLYEEANKQYYMTGHDFEIKSNLPYILHQADLTASRLEKQIYQK